MAGAEVVAICDPDQEKAAARAREFGVAEVFGDPQTMLAAVRHDAIDIAASMAAHVPLCHLAATQGVDILCQKPLAPTYAEAKALAHAAGGKVRLMVHENWRFRAQYRHVKYFRQRHRSP